MAEPTRRRRPPVSADAAAPGPISGPRDDDPGDDLPPSQVDATPDADPGLDPERGLRPSGRTAAEEMGIPPLWAIGGDKGRSTQLKKQVEAAEVAVDAARQEAREAGEKYLRLLAEMENMRRRHQKDREDYLLYGNAELITRVLPLLDNFHRALDHAPESAAGDAAVDQWVSGLQMVVRQFEEILAVAGVEPIEAEGQPFDPAQHQAVAAEPSDQHADGQVIAELQRGYRLRDRVLRPSMVKVANNS